MVFPSIYSEVWRGAFLSPPPRQLKRLTTLPNPFPWMRLVTFDCLLHSLRCQMTRLDHHIACETPPLQLLVAFSLVLLHLHPTYGKAHGRLGVSCFLCTITLAQCRRTNRPCSKNPTMPRQTACLEKHSRVHEPPSELVNAVLARPRRPPSARTVTVNGPKKRGVPTA
jgi:hypothetical protein